MATDGDGKYGNQRGGWEVNDANYKHSAMWKGIVSTKEKFMQNIRYQVGTGRKVLFWQDTWVGEDPLASKFPELYNCAGRSKLRWGITLIGLAEVGR